MRNYAYYKTKIKGYEDVSGTVKTIEKIAASGVHTIKKDVRSLNQHLVAIETVIKRLAICSEQRVRHPLLASKKNGLDVLLLVAGNKGLVGGLWHKMADVYFDCKQPKQSVVLVGTKSSTLVDCKSDNVLKNFNFSSEIPTSEEIDDLYDFLTAGFLDGTFKSVSVIYSKSISLGEQQVSHVPFLPFESVVNYNQETKINTSEIGLPIFETSANQLFVDLLNLYTKAKLYNLVLETKLSELSARTVSMEHATQKTYDLVGQLKVQYARQHRQTSTQKQLESYTAQKLYA